MGERAIKGRALRLHADPDGRVIEFHQVLDAVGAKDDKPSSPSVATTLQQ